MESVELKLSQQVMSSYHTVSRDVRIGLFYDYAMPTPEICVRFATIFNVEKVAVLTYDLVICKYSKMVYH